MNSFLNARKLQSHCVSCVCSLFTLCVGQNTVRKSQEDWLSKRAALHFVIILLTKLTINKTKKPNCVSAALRLKIVLRAHQRPTATQRLYLLLFPRSSKCIDQTFLVFIQRDVLRFFRGLYFCNFCSSLSGIVPLSVCVCVSESHSTIVSTEYDEFRKHEFVCAHCDRAILNNNNNEAKRFTIEIAHVSNESLYRRKKQISCFHSVSCFSWLQQVLATLLSFACCVQAIVLSKFIRTWSQVNSFARQNRKKISSIQRRHHNHLLEFRTFFLNSVSQFCVFSSSAFFNFVFLFLRLLILKSIENVCSQVCNLCRLPSNLQSSTIICECDWFAHKCDSQPFEWQREKNNRKFYWIFFRSLLQGLRSSSMICVSISIERIDKQNAKRSPKPFSQSI